VWYSEALDSEIYHCQWHRLVMELAVLPTGTQVVVSTYTNEESKSDEAIRQLPEDWWETCYAITGQMQAPPQPGNKSPAPRSPDVLVQSRSGRYLWVRLQLKGDGFGTPAVTALRIHYPRASYLDFLPAVFAADDESRWFLERYLSIFQTDWDALEGEIADISRYFDPKAVPSGPALDYLARWLALPLEGAWDAEQKRRLLVAAPQIYAQRSTPQSLQHYLQVYIHNVTGLSPAAQSDYPLIVEGFRERQFLQMSLGEFGVLGQGAPLWGPSIVGRLQLDVFANTGEVRLVSTGDPERDVFHQYAHRFRVFLPAAWVRTAEAERMIHRALDAEKPAHTQYDLCLVEPRVRVGLQSTVGLDTIIGGYPVARLACAQDSDAAPSQAPRHRLGYDTILAGQPAAAGGTQLRPATRVGIDTILQ
jgi:phage tail-like protein